MRRGGAATSSLAGRERTVVDALGGAAADADAIAAHSGLAVTDVQRLLLDLEMRGFVARDSTGAYYAVKG
jgi:predicted Rossmann fold nucleotide-binding protein DprA/Smf involved in DNA uptake